MNLQDPRKLVPTVDVGYAHRFGHLTVEAGVSLPLKRDLKRSVTGGASVSYSF